MVEHMVVPNLVSKFQELGFTFTKASPNVKIVDREHDIITEIDALLENGDKVMIVEIKTKPNIEDLQDHLERMRKLRVYADLRQDTRKYLGALAREHKALHVVSAWVNEHNLVLGQVVTDEKSNEITAIPRLLDLMDLAGDSITIDAMGYQTAIAEQIRNKQADYILAVNENQPTLYAHIRDYFEWMEQDARADPPTDEWVSDLEKDHGRIERRSIRTVQQLDWLDNKPDWKNLGTIIHYRCSRTRAKVKPYESPGKAGGLPILVTGDTPMANSDCKRHATALHFPCP
jgi:predicted transposase YbfD/YdcC